jgi:hypothetical protein
MDILTTSRKKLKKKLSKFIRIKPKDDIESGKLVVVNDKRGWCCIIVDWSYTNRFGCPIIRGGLRYTDDLDRPTWVKKNEAKMWYLPTWDCETVRVFSNMFNYDKTDQLPVGECVATYSKPADDVYRNEVRDKRISDLLDKFEVGKIYRECRGVGGSLSIVKEFLLIKKYYDSWGNIVFEGLPMYSKEQEIKRYHYRKNGDLKYMYDITDEMTKTDQTFFRQWAKLAGL